MNQTQAHELEQTATLLHDSLMADIKHLKDPMKFYEYMLNGMYQHDYNMDGTEDEYTMLEHACDIQKFMFEQMTNYKIRHHNLAKKAAQKDKDLSASSLLEKIRKTHASS